MLNNFRCGNALNFQMRQTFSPKENNKGSKVSFRYNVLVADKGHTIVSKIIVF